MNRSALALALGASMLACSCARQGERAVESAAPAGAQSGAPEPMLATGDDGMELHWWLAEDTEGRVGAALSRLKDADWSPEAQSSSAFEDSGLRCLRVPAEAFGRLEESVPPTRTRRREWLGWFAQWTEVFRGRRSGGPVPLLVEGGRRRFDPGTLRLIARAWLAPGVEVHSDPRVRLELAVQLLDDPAPISETIFVSPQARSVLEEGHIFPRTALRLTLEQGFAYVITSEVPGVAWRPAQEEPREDTEDPEQAPPETFDMFGPPASSARTVGEAMLSASSDETGSTDLKVVLVFIPRVPDRFQILP